MTRASPLSRVLHWTLAVLVLWQAGIVLSYEFLGPSPVLDRIAALGPSHGVVGLIVLPLAMLRLARHPASANRMSHGVHAALRLLLVAIPALALLRAYGTGKGWTHRGVPILPETGVEVAWMVSLGNIAHGELAWLMFALIALHVAGAIVHALRRNRVARPRS